MWPQPAPRARPKRLVLALYRRGREAELPWHDRARAGLV